MVTQTLLTRVFLAPQHGFRCQWSIVCFKAGCLHGPRTKSDSEMYPVSAPAMCARKASHSSKSSSIDVYKPLRDSVTTPSCRTFPRARSVFIFVRNFSRGVFLRESLSKVVAAAALQLLLFSWDNDFLRRIPRARAKSLQKSHTANCGKARASLAQPGKKKVFFLIYRYIEGPSSPCSQARGASWVVNAVPEYRHTIF
jgi:hypothetical protein